jgi:hypothetical protein
VPASPIQDRFVINGVEKDNGISPLTYNGNPERYLDCGHITSYVKNCALPRPHRRSTS